MKKGFIPLNFQFQSEKEVEKLSGDIYNELNLRRSVREFSDRPVSKKTIENLVAAASTAPSGAHKQPWFFCAISSLELKAKIKEAAEKEEYENYHGRMSQAWLKDLQPFETNEHKPFLTIAPWLVVLFRRSYDLVDGNKKQLYYTQESVGIAAGMFIQAVHRAGLACLTHTPSPMNFLQKVLNRPANEKPYLLMPVGYPAEDCEVPDIERKPLDEILKFYE